MHRETRASLRVKKRIASYRANPFKSPRRVDAVRGLSEDVEEGKGSIVAAPKKRRTKKKAQRRSTSKKRRAAPKRRAAARRPKRRKAAAPSRRRKAARRPRRRAAANPVQVQAPAQVAANPTKRRRRRRAAANPTPAANPTKRRRRSSRRKRAANPTSPIVVKVNPWPGQPRRHAKAAKKGWARRRAKGKGKRRSTAKQKRCRPCKYKRGPGGKFSGGLTRRELALSNPMPSAMSQNPLGYDNPFATRDVMSYGTAVAGLALGAIVADVVDRLVATRKPSDKEGSKAVRPWYGRDAAAAQRMRPDAWRLGAQAAGAVVALALAFWGRNIKFVPWLLGGTALGFGVNLLTKIADWYLMPALFKVKDPTEVSLANRLYPLEQDAVQKQITALFANWNTTDVLNAQQQETAAVAPPLASSSSIGVGKLSGKAEAQGAAAGVAGVDPSRQFLNTGRLGKCTECNGLNGCYDNCPTLCPNCEGYRPYKTCKYPVEAGDDLAGLARLGGVSIEAVNQLNGGTPDSYWTVGNVVNLPYGMCMTCEKQGCPQIAGVSAPASTPSSSTTTFPSELGTPPLASIPAQVAGPSKVNLMNLGAEESPDEQ